MPKLKKGECTSQTANIFLEKAEGNPEKWESRSADDKLSSSSLAVETEPKRWYHRD